MKQRICNGQLVETRLLLLLLLVMMVMVIVMVIVAPQSIRTQQIAIAAAQISLICTAAARIPSHCVERIVLSHLQIVASHCVHTITAMRRQTKLQS